MSDEQEKIFRPSMQFRSRVREFSNNSGVDVMISVALLVLTLVSVGSVDAAAAPYVPPAVPAYVPATTFTSTFYPTQSGAYFAGQEVRVKVTSESPSVFNRTKLRIGVIAAYANRQDSGTRVYCNSSDASFIFDSGNIGIKSYTSSSNWRYVVGEAYATFAVPPFAWGLCVRNTELPGLAGALWREADTTYPRMYANTSLFFRASVTMQEGDYATIAVVNNGTDFTYTQTIPSTTGSNLNGDNLKLVPAGVPCAAELAISRDTNQENVDYCGSNNVDSSGNWNGVNCTLQNSVAGGAAWIGTNALNPFVAALTTGFPRAPTSASEIVVAYVTLPTYGLYDVCYSPKSYRAAMKTAAGSNVFPMWFKITSLLSPRSRLQVTARVGTVTWSSMSSPIAGSYGSIRIRGAGDLSTFPATKWDPKFSGITKEYFNTTGGDVFRLVHFKNFNKPPPFVASTKSTVTGTSVTVGSGSEKVVINSGAIPSIGSVSPNSGCWVSADDNYGTFETPMGQPVCTDCESLDKGQTASGDLGGDPRSSESSFLQDLSNQFLAYARVRIPSVGGTWRVCYRKAGINNWMYLDWDTLIAKPYQGYFQGSTTNMNILLESQMNTNYTYVSNDTWAQTQKGTWAQISVQSTIANMETTSSTFFSTTVTQGNVRGAMLKVVDINQRCDAVSQIASTSINAGLPQCIPSQCNYVNGTCDGCTGSADETNTLRRLITFNLQLPSNISAVRVCFRNRVENWRILGARSVRLRKVMTLTDAPDVTYRMTDTRAGMWSRFIFYRTGGGLIDTASYSRTHGSIFRIVPTTARCDLVWVGGSNSQNFDNHTVDWQFGAHCPTAGNYPCLNSILTNTVGGVIGGYPYTDLNPLAMGKYVTTAAAFAVIPPSGASYRVCFKQATGNWFELTPQLTPVAAPTYTLTNTLPQYVAGSYVSFTVTCSNASINVSTVALKIVDGGKMCQFPALGTYGTAGLSYTSSSFATTDGSRIMAVGSNASNGLYSAVTFFLTLPTADATPLTTTTLLRRVCFMPEVHINSSWIDFGRIKVVSYSVGYTVDRNETPINGKQFPLKIISGPDVSLTSGYAGDAVKIVPLRSPCASNDTGNLPSDVTSFHAGNEIKNQNYDSILNLTNGVTYIPPGTSQSVTVNVTLPGASAATSYRVCYRLLGKVWMEILQTPVANRTLNLGTDGFITAAQDVFTLQVDAAITGSTPATSYSYGNKFLYPNTFIAGATTAYDSASVGGPSAVSDYFSVTGAGLSLADTLRIVTVHAESQTIAQYTTVQVVSCADSSADNNVYATVNPYKLSSTTTAYFKFMLPIDPGRYLFCYQRSGSTVWYQPGNANLNPAVVISSSVYVTIVTTTNTLTVIDGTQSLGANLGSLMANDKVYFIPSANGICGFTPSYSGNVAPSTAASTLTTTNIDSTAVYNTLYANSPSWYPVSTAGLYSVCFLKSAATKTKQSVLLRPVMNTLVWYRVTFFISGFFYNSYRKMNQNPSLSFVCPPAALTTGTPFALDVSVKDPDTSETLTTSVPTTLTAIAETSWVFSNTGGTCSGSTLFNTSIATSTGTARFTLTPLSACPADGCKLKFISKTTSNSTSCTVTINAAAAISSVRSNAPASCSIGSACSVSLTALDAGGAIVYGSNAAISVATTSTYPGLGFKVNGAAVTDITTLSLSLVNGIVTFALNPFVANSNLWLAASASYLINVDFTIAGVVQRVVITVPRPSITSVAITGVTMVNWNGTVANDEDTNQHLRWEPTSTFGAVGFWDKSSFLTTLAAGPSRPWLAGQYYKVTLVPLDPVGNVVTDNNFINGATVAIGITPKSGVDGSSNAVIAQPSSESAMHSFVTPFAPVALTPTSIDVIFRLKNSAGCPMNGGCSIDFSFGANVTVSRIRTSVRSVARKLVAQCGAPALVNSSTLAKNGTCPNSAVEKGVTISVIAVDQFGIVDEYFNGDVFVQLLRGNKTVADISLTTVAQLKQSLTIMPSSARFVNGELFMNDFTTSQPCADCVAQFFSDLNAGYAYAGLSILPSTASLACTLSKSSTYYVMKNDFSNVDTLYNQSLPATQSLLVVYPTTDLCFDVSAVNAQGEVTLYEQVWVNWAVAGQSGAIVRGTPAAQTPFVYRPLQFSKGRFCINVNGTDGSNFIVAFIAQHFASPAHWASKYSTGQALTETFRLTTKRFIGGLKLAFGPSSPLTPVSGANVNNGLWGRYQLADVNQQVSVVVNVVMIDHYGNPFNSTDLQSSQVSFFITPGACASGDISGGQCFGNGGSGSKLTVNPFLPVREGGVLSVVLQSASYTLLSSTLSFTFNIRRWCLVCDIPLVVFSGASAYSDSILGAISSNIRLSFLIPVTLPLYVAFRTGNSPFFPVSTTTSGFRNTKWRHWQAGDAARPTVANGFPMLFYEGCFNGTNNNECAPNTNLFSYGACASSTPEVLTGADGGDMKLVVYRSTQVMQYGESVCVGDCFTGNNVPTSQIDIFSAYTYTITVGTQNLQCKSNGGIACAGQGTAAVSQTVPALGATIDEALLALNTLNDVPSTRMQLVGQDASSFVTVDAITGAALTGSGNASKSGPLLVTAVSVAAPSTSIASLKSVSGVGAAYGTYHLQWRGPARATQVVVASPVADMDCPSFYLYDTYVAPTSASYNGYLTRNVIGDIAVSYSSSVIPINTPFPFTVEIRDTSNNLVPSASGSVAVSIVDWVGCGNGGTASIVGSNTFTNGRVTLWVSFSDSCENCKIRFDLTANIAQSDLYELVMNSAQKQSVSVSGVRIQGFTQNTSVAAFSLTNPATQVANISVDDVITVQVAAFSNVGGIAVRDNSSAISIEAYNYLADNMAAIRLGQEGGDGGFLRLPGALTDNPSTVKATATNGVVSLSFSFQRACQYGCKILIVWRLPATATVGSFLLKNQNGTTFFVTAPTAFPLLVARASLRKTIRYNAAFPYAVRVALRTPSSPFVGWSINSSPAVVTPAITVVDNTDGTSGVMSLNITNGAKTIIYHLNFSEPCYECRIDFGTTSTPVAIQPVATQFRVTSLSPSIVNVGDNVTASLYATDDMGYLDFTVGGQIRCPFEIPFLCSAAGIPLTIVPSQDGLVANNFYPSVANLHVGGTGFGNFTLANISGFSMKDGGAQTVFAATNRVAYCVPIFSDGKFSTAPYPTYGFSTQVGNISNLFVSLYRPILPATIYEPYEIVAAMTLKDPATNVNIVVPEANHTFLLTTNGNCPMTILDGKSYRRTYRGKTTFTVIFSEPATSACNITITAVAGNGNCTPCAASVLVSPSQRVATSWNFIRPTPAILSGTSTAVLYGAMLRPIVIQVQLYNLVGGKKQAQSCNGCGLLFTPTGCSPAPSFSPSGGAIFDSNGTATVRVSWQINRDPNRNATITGYSCSLATSISGTSIDGPFATSYSAIICNTSKLMLLNGTFDSDIFHRRLSTSKSYTFIVAMTDDNGIVCPGDSQYDVSTVVTVALEYADGSRGATNVLDVVNLNRTTQSTNALPRSYNNTVYLLDGKFYFRLIFTNASDAPIRLRFSAYSKSPSISMSTFSPSFNVYQDAAQFNIFPLIPTVVSSFRTYNFSLITTDLVPYDWLADKSRVPNVVPRNFDYYMVFNRTFYATNPLTFAAGSPVGTLANGTTSFSVKFNLPAGPYSFWFFSRYSPVSSSSPVTITVQTPYRFAFVTVGFYPGVPFVCHVDCFMPIVGTAFEFDAVAQQMTINTPKTFRFAVALVDENDQLVTSETDLTVGCKVLKTNDAADANIAFAPSLVQTGPLFVPLTKGIANYSIGFVGSTTVAGTANPLRLMCYCASGDCPANIPSATTLPIVVTSVASNSNISVALTNAPVFKIPTTLTSLDQFNKTSFVANVLSVLSGSGISYIQMDNAESSLQLTICEVERKYFGFSDLRGSVCGPQGLCNGTSNSSTCPPFVYRCRCPTLKSTTSAVREFSEEVLSGTNLQIEMVISLLNAPAFQPSKTSDVTAAYLSITNTLYDSLSSSSNPTWAQYKVLSDTIVTGSSTDTVAGATQTPQPAGVSTPTPGTPAPSAASIPSNVLVALLVVLFGTLFAM